MLEKIIEKTMLEDNCIANMVFENEKISEFDMSGIEFKKVQFIKCELNRCDFSRSVFRDVEFLSCYISLSDFSKTFWKNVKIVESNAVGGKFIESCLKETTIKNSSLDYSNFTNSTLSNCDFENSKFKESYFSEVKIKKLKLKEIIFSGTDFFKTSLNGIDLSDCQIDGIKVSVGFPELKGSKINSIQAVELVRVFDIDVV